ncbi:hypothetical protein GGR57DRAFT_199062 [Xylariaceae sp. FL1272]|nr:hypothetical protein GGR57DRAFT_199062 [Xylariaceae sp. FL1272]
MTGDDVADLRQPCTIGRVYQTQSFKPKIPQSDYHMRRKLYINPRSTAHQTERGCLLLLHDAHRFLFSFIYYISSHSRTYRWLIGPPEGLTRSYSCPRRSRTYHSRSVTCTAAKRDTTSYFILPSTTLHIVTKSNHHNETLTLPHTALGKQRPGRVHSSPSSQQLSHAHNNSLSREALPDNTSKLQGKAGRPLNLSQCPDLVHVHRCYCS